MTNIEKLYTLFTECEYRYCTDTRKIIPGSLFFALKGENFNGNTFAASAIAAGASFAIVDEDMGDNPQFIKVTSVLATLQHLAQYHKSQCKAKVLGIGGSNGKTTTKELVSAVLSTQYTIQFTKGNLNNHIGVPFTLLDLKQDCEIAVVELGANHIGDIEELCQIAHPDMGIITNIGKEHLEGFGSIEGVAKAESELFDFLLKNNGLAFVNLDDQWLGNMSKRLSNKKTYSIEHTIADTLVTADTLVPYISFSYKGITVNTHLMGAHNLQNIAAAVAIAEHFNITPANIAKGLASYVPVNNRSQIIETAKGNTILLDAYNANPSSVESIVKTFSTMNNKPQLMVIGDMFELGEHAHAEHLAIAEMCSGLNSVKSVLVGSAFHETGFSDPNVQIFEHKKEAIEYVNQHAFNGYNVLIKGSRGMKMEDFTELF
ncbi:MAG: UDP-N-acetylmuramoyl-tripeptide--D-alanyl-D-alanine ligase [Bacteroidota bacterium]